jgi:hypothetical protein
MFATHTRILFVTVTVLAPVSLVAHATEIKPGEWVVVSNAGAKLMVGAQVRAELDKGTEFRVTSIRGDWLGGHVTVSGETRAGWVRRNEVWPRIELTIPSTTTFSLKKIKPLWSEAIGTWRASNVKDVPWDDGSFWYKSTLDPTKVVDVFDSLRLKKGVVLRAYQLESGGDSWGYVWALPADAKFPEPQECPQIKAPSILRKPDARKPPAALDDVIEAIEGDGSPWSYLAASLLKRQLEELGSRWHGRRWTDHRVIDRNLWKSPKVEEDVGIPLSDDWKAFEPEPREWRPQVQIREDEVTVIFFTYCVRRREAIYKQTDRYKLGSYRSETDCRKIAEGRGGVVF